jgi:ribokinase
MRNKIVVVGSSNTDMIVQTPHLPRPGETVLGGTFSTAAGGKGANQAVAAARVGGSVTFVARVGQDGFGDQAVQGFADEGIDVDYIVHDSQAPSGVALISVDAQGENCIVVASGANNNLGVADLNAAAGVIASADTVLMQLETPLETVEAAARMAHAQGVRVILNPAPACELSDALLGSVSILTPNETEAELLTGITVTDEASAQRAAEVLIGRGVETVILTLGAAGAYVYSEGFQGIVPSYPVEPVDTTAAGDTFNGVLAVALAEGRSLEQAVIFANAAAALSVTQLGAQPSAPDRERVEAFLKERS